MYIIGAAIKRFGIDEKISLFKAVMVYAICVAIIWIEMIVEHGCSSTVCGGATAYCNPFVICEACSIFIVFMKLKIGSIRFINLLSSGVFTVFLLHGYFFDFLGINKMANVPMALLIIHIGVSAICIFLISVILSYIYRFVTEPFLNIVFRKWNGEVIKIQNCD